MDAEVIRKIQKRIDEIEKEHDIEVILAVESGSRAWGFESTDSDYDVRFIYKHDVPWYLNVFPKRDVIEYPIIDEYDYSGWDLRKTFYLMSKSNPVLFEWLKSPIVYKKDNEAFARLKEAAERYFSPLTSIYHYLHMAKRIKQESFQEDLIKIKKYFYALRPLFACMWIEAKNENPPLEFDQLIAELNLDNQLVGSIQKLLERKKAGIELGLEPRNEEICQFVEKQTVYFENYLKTLKNTDKPHSGYLDEKFQEILLMKSKFF